MQKLAKILPSHFRFLGAVYLALVAVFTLFRYVTFVYHGRDYNASAEGGASLAQAFQKGFLIDLSVAGYILLIPTVIVGLSSYLNFQHPRLMAWMRSYIVGAVLLSLLICAADVPYYYFFNSRLNASALNFKNTGQVLKFVFREVQYYPFILVFFVGIWAVRKFVSGVWTRTWIEHIDLSPLQKLATVAILSTLVSFVTLGGTIKEDEPLLKSAYFSNDGFLNQLALNPVHTYFDSYFEEFNIHAVTLEEAVHNVQTSFGIQSDSTVNYIAREHIFSENLKKKPKNVVLILMESMSNHHIGTFGNRKNLTPGLDALIQESMVFKNHFSNGIHTNAGLYSTLFSYPIMMMQHPMNNGLSEYRTFKGLPITLGALGYSTSFFCTHPRSFDNLDVFLEKNGFEYISDLADYPEEKHVNAWGVGDETLFEHSLSALDSMATHAPNKPFFSTILTITAHPPYSIPEFTTFQPRSTDLIDISYEYADWSIKNFMDSVATKDWYDETLFVILGDHGMNLHDPTDAPLSYNQVPLIFHAPSILPTSQVLEDLANQTDVFPTIMGLLELDYKQETFGYDLFREKRPYAFFSQDQKLGVTDGKQFYVVRKSGFESLNRIGSVENTIQEYRSKADSMLNYACSMLLVSQEMIKNDTGL